ncbi:TPA: Rieske 2Fe-2S domain-containing protein [Xanthomonas vasicola pv. zeae]|uniref:Ribosomal subunit interface protein n=2 Tax=Xanthomonas vasicola pv. vasculorum TaxID=325776 RepID=A0A836P740_XANVA|nr:Rieske 2Fe-2S domain-containing protein [Xanthomonas vasicola]AVQ07250.1 ribosomal subunit interface protein [Xanthomonas vasicola pv. vasculorum]AZM71451.1 ribosomal subunit interface protein [Xanthomonas vasicola pv. vasculorum]AZR27361.1 aromatic ring-hydroxylating dioxygenase subunit alpha [Xanthomonas vasicola pv. arecae]AZR35069.1 aromatic ring-hydroxylating dioxygenase subunit alpha [Xanthomonas vasicola]KEZ96248.1 ribosomal subunit interface protein [Xanthomonas vasicola pv. vasculo
MRSRMHPSYYLSTDIFEREQRKIFRKAWLFAGLKTLLLDNNCFITRRLAGIPVLIQNFKGRLRAFENVCLHRSALLQTTAVGKRPLVCPYHAWKYDSDGQVENIPECDALYGFGEEERRGLKLREFALHEVGNLLFVNLDPNPMPIEEQFSADFIALLESSSNAYDTEVMVTTWRGRYNWKLAYENLRDANHPRFVHPKTLAKSVSFVAEVNQEHAKESMEALQDSSPAALRREMRRFSYGGPDAPIPNLQHFGWHEKVERWGTQDAYFNWLVFPNMHIASSNGGYSFTLEHHIPVAPDRTDLEIYWFSARKKQPYGSSSQVLLAQMHGSKVVVGEDVDIMERVQAALHIDAPFPTQGAYESMNRLVERWYALLMETEHEI